MLCCHGLHRFLFLNHSATAIRWTDPYTYSDTNDALRPVNNYGHIGTAKYFPEAVNQ